MPTPEDTPEPPPEKTCTQCGARKPLADFPRDRRAKDGHRADCKACNAKKSRTYQAAHSAARRHYARTYAAAHRDERRLYNQQYNAKHGEEIRAQQRQYYTLNRKDILRRQRARWHNVSPQRQAARRQRRNSWYRRLSAQQLDHARQ